ncbi:hypothetical protein FB45DRAFT_1113548 [Roridomyces roridus]|uniref:Isochorismatase-like domain-containing protein n=1 Tax=Roridomyces roridus TaxID=1738132 RepID=A0AAD7FU71_9AGAR|nr:hypothetical protein FB45DRAFT_1113548 [Roridomyces roridus]
MPLEPPGWLTAKSLSGNPQWSLLWSADSIKKLEKEKSNAFTGTKLGQLISPDEEIVVVGLLSDYSVKHTCRGALERGNTVILIRGAHGTYDHLDIGERGRFTPAARISARVEEELDEAGVMILNMKYLPDIFEGR